MNAVKRVKEKFKAAHQRAAELNETIAKKRQVQEEREQVEKLIRAVEMAETFREKEARFRELRREFVFLLLELEHQVKTLVPHWRPIVNLRTARGNTWTKYRAELADKQHPKPAPGDNRWLPEWMPSNTGPEFGSGIDLTIKAVYQECREIEGAEDNEEDA